MKILLFVTLLFISTGCDNFLKKTNNSELDSVFYLCSKCESILYDEKDLFYENNNSQDFSISLADKVVYDLNSSEKKTSLFCKKCNNEIGNYIVGDSININSRHCINKNSIILNNILK